MRKPGYLFVTATAAVVFSAPAMAQDAVETADIVTGDPYGAPWTMVVTGEPERVDEVGQAVTVLGEGDVVQGPDIVRLIERAPGVTVARNGPVGGFTGVFVRGAASEQTLVLVDGVRVSDVASPGGGFDFGNLLLGEVERVELLRGSNSTVWGSDATVGVISVVTRLRPEPVASVEYGGDDELYLTASGGVQGDRYGFGIGASHYEGDGFSSAASGTEPDGFRQTAVHARADLMAAENLDLAFSGRYADGRLDIDGYPAPNYTFADTAEYQDTRQLSARAQVRYVAIDRLELQAAYTIADTARDLFDPASGDAAYFESDGKSQRAEFSANYMLFQELDVKLGAEREWQDYRTEGYGALSDGTARLSSAYALVDYDRGPVHGSAGVRLDDHDRFGSQISFGANGSWEFAEHTRLRASYGEGFKTPTLYQLLSDYGNRFLQPETSKSLDVGIEHGTRGAPVHAALTLFRRDSRNLIDFVSCFGSSAAFCTDPAYPRPFGTYDNIGRARAQGVEVELGAQVSERLSALAVYSYIDTENRTAGSANEGNWLARRPRHALTTSMDWRSPLAGLSLGGDVRLVGDSFDDAGNVTRLDGYALVDVRASMPLGEKVEIFGRVENVFDTDYTTVAGYGTQGRAAYLGARLRM